MVCGISTPDTVEDARASPEWDRWRKAIAAEMEALFKMGTFEYCRRSDMEPGKRTTKCKWVFKLKQNSDGTISRFKARKVVQGFRLRQGEDYHDTYSPTLGGSTLRLMTAIAVQTGQRISTGDVGNAYVEADMEDDQVVYIEQDPEYSNPLYPADEYVLRMKKTLYGMPHSGRAFGIKLTKVMASIGLTPCDGDKALYHKTTTDGKTITVGAYVDDLICMTAHEDLRQEWEEALRLNFQKVEFEPDLTWMLNIAFREGRDQHGRRYIGMSQKLAIEKVAEKVGGIITKSPEKLPIIPMRTNADVAKRREGEEDAGTYDFEYRSVLGALMHISNWTRPDIQPAVNKLARYAADPTTRHFQLLHDVAAFAYRTRERELKYTETVDNPLKLSGASDSSFNDDPDTSRSTIGWGLWLGEKCSGLIHWTSTVPKVVALSSTNAEIQAALGLARDVVWFRTLMDDLGYKQRGSTVMYQDNDPAIQQIQDVKGTAKSKHYLVKLRYIQELLHLGIIHMNPIDTKENIADLYTKPLGSEAFWYLSNQIMGDSDFQKFSPLLRGLGAHWAKSNEGGGKARGRKAPHSKTSLVQRYIDSEYGAAVYPSDNIHRATCTGSSYASINGFYGGIHQLRDHERIQNMH